ncbi:MAG: branched-chain amino acid ABC transporter substrate-binding protein, partial [Acidimicrobiia bacterium]|nr:branched-chain amino acid ABC transporter substrate-binding protein [Acidimicrobiia bacterium]
FVQTGGFVCRDPLGCVSYAAEDPLRLATALVTSGPVALLLGVDELRGVEIALDFRGPVLGHAIALRNEDSMCNPDGGEAAANAIAADPTITAVIGTTCSGAATTAAPIISDAGLSMVSPSNTSPLLTDPDTHAAGYLRVAWNDRDQAAAMAAFVAGEGATTSAVVVDGDPYTVALGEAFVETFQGLGGTNLAFEVAEPDGSDVAAVVAAVVGAGVPDVLYFPVYEPLGSAIVTEARATPALDETVLAASDGLAPQAFVDGVGDDTEGMLFTVGDPAFTETPEYAAFAAAYLDEFGEDPLTLFSAFAFDATNVILEAIEGVGIVDGAGTLHIGRQALRDALFATAGFEGLTGTITCDPLGDCGATGFVILTVVGGELVPAP